MTQHRITKTGNLLDAQGLLREAGYALKPPFVYNREDIAVGALRIKDWDYYLVNDDHRAVALTFSDLGYIGLVSASVLDFGTASYKTSSELVILPLGRMGVPRSSESGDIHWKGRQCKVDFVLADGTRRLSFAMTKFDGDDDLEVELLLDQEPQDSMVICTPWAEDPQAFYYNRKIVGMQARGGYRRGSEFYQFEEGTSFGLLDWGRGVWTYDNTWYWSAAQGTQAGHVVGFNLGYGFGDTSAASENMLFVDGVAHKLGKVDFGIPGNVEAGYRYMDTWRVHDDEGRLDLAFVPQIDRTDLINVAGIVKTDQHQVFGTFSGTLTLDDGTKLEVKDLRGFAEHVHNKY